MKKVILLFFVLASSFSAFAGDGGYVVHSCTSQSGRTQLSVFRDNYSGSEKPYTIRLIIDGQEATYESANNESPNIIYDWDNGTFAVYGEGNSTALSIEVMDDYAVVYKGYKDPRVGTAVEYYANNQNDIRLSCTRYEQGP